MRKQTPPPAHSEFDSNSCQSQMMNDRYAHMVRLRTKCGPMVNSLSTFASVPKQSHFVPTEQPHGQELAFVDIVDESLAQDQMIIISNLARKLANWQYFRLFVILVILANSILVGVQTNYAYEKRYTQFFEIVDTVFLTVFVLEILVKWQYSFIDFWQSSWNVFDFIIVAISLVGQDLSFATSGRLFRIFRVFRAFRTLRAITALRHLQIIVQTIVKSLADIVNIFFLTALMFFIFAVVGVNLFREEIPEHFGAVQDSIFSLFIALTQDGYIELLESVEATQVSSTLVWALRVYFMLFIIIGAFVLTNLMVGVLVTHFEFSVREKNKEKRRIGVQLSQKTTSSWIN